jgi:hypothetical protein
MDSAGWDHDRDQRFSDDESASVVHTVGPDSPNLAPARRGEMRLQSAPN